MGCVYEFVIVLGEKSSSLSELFLDSNGFTSTIDTCSVGKTLRFHVLKIETMFILPLNPQVPEKIQELHYLAEAMRDLASKPGGASVSFDEWKNFALKMKEELKILGIQATAEVK